VSRARAGAAIELRTDGDSFKQEMLLSCPRRKIWLCGSLKSHTTGRSHVRNCQPQKEMAADMDLTDACARRVNELVGLRVVVQAGRDCTVAHSVLKLDRSRIARHAQHRPRSVSKQ
jgi:hypothetical protein